MTLGHRPSLLVGDVILFQAALLPRLVLPWAELRRSGPAVAVVGRLAAASTTSRCSPVRISAEPSQGRAGGHLLVTWELGNTTASIDTQEASELACSYGFCSTPTHDLQALRQQLADATAQSSSTVDLDLAPESRDNDGLFGCSRRGKETCVRDGCLSGS